MISHLLDEGYSEREILTECLTWWPSYHPPVLLKLYIYCYLSRVQSSRHLIRRPERSSPPIEATFVSMSRASGHQPPPT